MGIKTSMLLAGAVSALVGTCGSAQGAIVQFQAESGTLGSNFQTTAVSGAIGGNVIERTDTTGGNGNTNPLDTATYSVTFSQAGTYDLYMRWVVPSSQSHDSFYVNNQFGTGGDEAELNGLAQGHEHARDATVVTGGTYLDYSVGDFVWVDLTSNWIESVGGGSNNTNTEIPVFTVDAPGTLTWQAAGRETTLQVDAFAFATSGQQVGVDAAGNLVPVPEPASLALLGLAAGLFVIPRRRRSRA